MTSSTASAPHEPLSIEDRIHPICEQFEKMWQSGEPPTLEEWVSQVEKDLRDPVLHELLKIDVEYRARKGETLEAEHYLRLFPEHTTVIEEVFQWVRSLPSIWLPTIPGFRIMKEIGRGGMGVVYHAIQESLGRDVAVKMIHHAHYLNDTQRQRLIKEAQTIACLEHPNIVQIYEIGEQSGSPYFTMELIRGGSLDRQLHGAPMSPIAAAELVEKLARAVQIAHNHGIIHRDLKPANILLGVDGEPRITDFGLAKHLDEAGHTRSNSLVGTPSYAAPEQAQGRLSEIGPGTDIHALGAVLYECLTGRPPFKSTTIMKTLSQVIHEEALSPILLVPDIPVDLETICLKCLRKEPARRYTTALELATDLRLFLKGKPIHARPLGPWARFVQNCKRSPMVTSLVSCMVLLMVLFVIGGALFYNQVRMALAEKHVEVAHFAAQAGQWEQSLSHWRMALDKGHSNPVEAQLQIYRILSMLGREQEAKALLAKIARHPDREDRQADIYLWQADALLQAGLAAQGRKQLEKALSAGLTGAGKEYALALKAPTTKDAIERLKRTITIERWHHPARAQLAFLLLLSGDRSEARAMAQQTLQWLPADLSSLITLSWLEALEGNLQEGRQYISQAGTAISLESAQSLIRMNELLSSFQSIVANWKGDNLPLQQMIEQFRQNWIEVAQTCPTVRFPPQLTNLVEWLPANEPWDRELMLQKLNLACRYHNEGSLHFLRGILQLPQLDFQNKEAIQRAESQILQARNAFLVAASQDSLLPGLRQAALYGAAVQELTLAAGGMQQHLFQAGQHLQQSTKSGPWSLTRARAAFEICLDANAKEAAWICYQGLQQSAQNNQLEAQNAYHLAKSRGAFEIARQINFDQQRDFPNDMSLLRERMAMEWQAKEWLRAMQAADAILAQSPTDAAAIKTRRMAQEHLRRR